ncbi:MAG TPA: AraC family transcriptional regulator [Pedobacter sp.]|nr:AraC family transcriptional regulator [Pedobacter sp.]
MNLFLHKDKSLNNQISIPEEIQNRVKNLPFKNLIYLTHVSQSLAKTANHTTDYVLIYCLSGAGQCTTQQGSFQLKANQFMLLSPNDAYQYQSELDHTWKVFCVHFNGNMINELNTTFDLKKFSSPTDINFDGQLVDCWQEIFSSLLKGLTDENIAYANLCLYRFISFFLFPSPAQKTTQGGPEREDQLDQSITFMKANVHKRLCVDEIAETFRYSPSHYSVLFKQKTGLSPIEYFIRIKIQRASELLTNSNLIVKEIAGEVGYDDPFYFTRIFKKVTGKTPKEYKGSYGSYQMGSTVHRMSDFNHSLVAS